MNTNSGELPLIGVYEIMASCPSSTKNYNSICQAMVQVVVKKQVFASKKRTSFRARRDDLKI